MRTSNKKNVDVPLTQFVLCSIYSVTRNEEVCTFERLVAECFSLFPHKFSFERYPQWPDSSRLLRPLRSLAESGLITGTVKTHFELTKFGLERAKVIYETLVKSVPENKDRKITPRSVDDKLIDHMLNSPLLAKFRKDGSKSKFRDQEIVNFLLGTLDTPKRVLKQNLRYFINLAKEYEKKELLEFLNYLKKRYFTGRRRRG